MLRPVACAVIGLASLGPLGPGAMALAQKEVPRVAGLTLTLQLGRVR